MKYLEILCTAGFVLFFATTNGLHAETAAEKGLRIATKASQQSTGFRDLQVDGEMVLKAKGVATSTRRFEVTTADVSDGGRSLLVFKWPGDIANTALLTHSYDNRSDDQWLYLPSLSKVRRISSSGRSGSFVGSEFAYEDMVDQDVSKFMHTWISSDGCPNGGTCDVIDRVPTSKSGYSRQRVWFGQKNSLVQRVQYFNKQGGLQKTLTFSGYKRHNNKFWRASRLNMENHVTKRGTTLSWSNYRFNVGLNMSQFSVNSLRRLY